MMYKLLTAVALVASQMSSASACGWMNEGCCANNVCKADRSACWEGTCMPCGMDGKPVCPNGHKCDEGNKVKDNFCVHDNGPAPTTPAPSKHCGWINEQCCEHNVCKADRSACWEGTCMDCGKNGKPKCATGKPCDDGNVVNKDGWCSTYNPPHVELPAPEKPPPSKHCGWLNERCCAHNVCKADRSACWEGTCMPCGLDGKPICPKGRKCDTGNKVKDNFCVHDNGPKKGMKKNAGPRIVKKEH